MTRIRADVPVDRAYLSAAIRDIRGFSFVHSPLQIRIWSVPGSRRRISMGLRGSSFPRFETLLDRFFAASRIAVDKRLARAFQ